MTRNIDLDRLLEAAGSTPDARPRYDLEAGCRHIADRQAVRRVAAAAQGGRRLSRPAPPVRQEPSVRYLLDDAGRDLKALTKLVINEPDACTWLDGLVTRWEPRGGLVFGCLLDLTGQPFDAQWWWQYAAGAGNLTAAYCLYLHHICMGELRDAEHWFHQAARLDEDAPPLVPPAMPDLPGYPYLHDSQSSPWPPRPPATCRRRTRWSTRSVSWWPVPTTATTPPTALSRVPPGARPTASRRRQASADLTPGPTPRSPLGWYARSPWGAELRRDRGGRRRRCVTRVARRGTPWCVSSSSRSEPGPGGRRGRCRPGSATAAWPRSAVCPVSGRPGRTGRW